MQCKTCKNPYIPKTVAIHKITIENDSKDLKTFTLEFQNKKDDDDFSYRCGQFAMISVPGAGECPVGIASSPLDKGFLEFTVKKYPHGVVTSALHNLSKGEFIGVRGPYGNSFPLDEMNGKNIVIVGGGFAFTTLRSVLRFILHEDNRSRFKSITVIYGARNPGELLYKSELTEWLKRKDMTTYITVDKGDETWNGLVGFVPDILKQKAPVSQNTAALVCGPPIMLKFTIPVLCELGFSEDAIYTSLERKMSCGIGKCGKCNIEDKYICKDGPVFTYKEISTYP
ncbi:MAG: FAD/NAD(P)-binding protein [Spirochaetales bacterium]|nr:FAD/NAD(P)-binding protein [Spirochaetales bacterium]